MNGHPAGWGYPRPDLWNYHQLDNQGSSAGRWPYGISSVPPENNFLSGSIFPAVSGFPPESSFPPGSISSSGSNCLTGRKRPRLTDRTCYSPPAKRGAFTSGPDFDSLVKTERIEELKKISDRYGKSYNGNIHGKYATEINAYAKGCNRLLDYHEQNCLIPCLQEFKPQMHWSWRSLTTITHSFISAGVFTPQQFTSQAVRHTQVSLLTELLDALRYTCNQKPEVSDINSYGITVVLWGIAKLVDSGHELTAELKEAVVDLLPHVHALKDQFIALGIANLLWALAKLVENGHELTSDIKKTIATLSSRVIALKDQFGALEISNLLWAFAKLVSLGHELTTELKEAVTALLLPVIALRDQLKHQSIAIVLWAFAKLVDNGLELSPEIKETVAALLPRVIVLKDQYNAQGIANLLWAMAKLVDNGLELTTELKEAVAILWSRIDELKAQFIPQNIANLLWALAKLVDNGHELTPDMKEAVATLLPLVIALKDQFKPLGIGSQLWALVKLMQHGQELIPEIKEALAALLPYVNVFKYQFDARTIATLVWVLVKLGNNVQELTPQFRKAAAALLPRVSALYDHFNAEDIVGLLWSTGKLTDTGEVLIPEFKEVLAALLPQMNEQRADLKPEEIAKLLMAIGIFGDLIDTAATLTLVESLPCETDKYLQLTPDELLMFLWGLLACGAKLYLERNTGNKNDMLECLIDRLFTHLKNESINNDQRKTIMAQAAGWLGKDYLFNPDYRANNSKSEDIFYAQLQSALPSVKIEQEKSLCFMPPVDLFLPEHNIVIEIQGPSHYISQDFQTRNGATLLKIALLQKHGFDVIEIPINQLYDPDLARTYIGQIQQKTTEFLVDNDIVSF